MKKRILIISPLIVMSILLMVFSLYSVSYKSWIWEGGTDWQKILGTLSGLAAFTGVVATILFWKRKKGAYPFALINALLFGSFALSWNLTGDFIVNLFWIFPILIVMLCWFRKRIMTKYVLTNKSTIILSLAWVVSFIFFMVVTPYINMSWSKVLHLNNFGYGSNFKFYWAGRVLDSLMNSLTVVGMVMMIRGYKQTWYVWLFKNIIAIFFFGGIAVVDISIIIMNVVYLILMFVILYENKKKKGLKVAIIGPGAVGKTTVIKNLKEFLEDNDMTIFDERDGIITDDFSEYMENMPKHAYRMQKGFFDKRIEQLKEMSSSERGLMDRHSTDDFIFSRLHIEEGNFSKEQADLWLKKDEPKYWNTLKSLPKLDLLFILMADDELIETRRSQRSDSEELRATETKNKLFFRKANAMYHDENSIMYKAFMFSNKQIFITNTDSLKTSEKIKKHIAEHLNNK